MVVCVICEWQGIFKLWSAGCERGGHSTSPELASAGAEEARAVITCEVLGERGGQQGDLGGHPPSVRPFFPISPPICPCHPAAPSLLPCQVAISLNRYGSVCGDEEDQEAQVRGLINRLLLERAEQQQGGGGGDSGGAAAAAQQQEDEDSDFD